MEGYNYWTNGKTLLLCFVSAKIPTLHAACNVCKSTHLTVFTSYPDSMGRAALMCC